PLLEVLERFAERPAAARNIPLILDLVVAYRIRRREWQLPDFQLWQVSNPTPTIALIKLLLVFLRSAADLPPEFAGLLGDRPTGGQEALLSPQPPPESQSVQPTGTDIQQEALELTDNE